MKLFILKYIFLFFFISRAWDSFSQEVNFNKDIAPVIFKNCSYCHSKNGSAPFSLTTYNEVVSKKEQIQYVVNNKIMPPWQADTHFRKFLNQRILSDTEINLIDEWIKQGAKKGKSNVSALDSDKIKKHSLGKPDMTLKMPVNYKIVGNNRDTLVRFLIPFQLPKDTFAYAIEVIPGNIKAIHHANPMFYDKDAPKAELGENILITDVITETITYKDTFGDANLIFYADFIPGAGPQILPENFGFRIPRNGFILFEMHYGPSPIDLFDQTSINIYFADKKTERVAIPRRIGSGGGIAEPFPPLVIPPDTLSRFTIDALIPHDISILFLAAHMHYLGKSMKAIAITPESDTILLISVDNYDFRWQETCRPEKLIHIPKGSHILVEAVFDNTTGNPNNPYHPPRYVKQGWQATDEMMSFPIYFTEYWPGDENISNRK